MKETRRTRKGLGVRPQNNGAKNQRCGPVRPEPALLSRHSPARHPHETVATRRSKTYTSHQDATVSINRNKVGRPKIGKRRHGKSKNDPPNVSNYSHPGHDRKNLPTEQTSRYMNEDNRKPVKYKPPIRSPNGPMLSWDRGDSCEDGSLASPLYIREKIHPSALAESLQKRGSVQLNLFGNYDGLPKNAAYEWYRHRGNWQNRVINGESRRVMASLLAKESMAGKVQMVYFDPPYGIKFSKNMQPDARKRDVSDNSRDSPNDPVHLRVFRDTYENGMHSYLDNIHCIATHARELLTSDGSFFMQIGGANVHRAAVVLDEVFGAENRVATITFAKSGGSSSRTLPMTADYILWYKKDSEIKVKYHQLYEELPKRKDVLEYMSYAAKVELASGEQRNLSRDEKIDPDKNLPPGSKLYTRMQLTSQNISTTGRSDPYYLKSKNKTFKCPRNRQWSVSHEGIDHLDELGRLDGDANSLRLKLYEDEIPGKKINNLWHRQMSADDLHYVVETDEEVIERCILMATDPGDLVLDPTCGSGTTAYVAEKWGRRWITSDSSLVAVTLARQRLLTGIFDYHFLQDSADGSQKERELSASSANNTKPCPKSKATDYNGDPSKGFVYERIKTPSASTLAYDYEPPEILLVNRPLVKNSIIRVSSPFTVESHSPYRYVNPDLAMPNVGNVDDIKSHYRAIVHALEFSGLKIIRDNTTMVVNDVFPYTTKKGTWITHTALVDGRKAALMIAPDDCTVPPELVDRAAEEAARMGNTSMLIVIAFAFEADVRSGELEERGRLEIYKAQANQDLLVGNLKDSESDRAFVLIGEPDILVSADTNSTDQIIVRVDGYDTYNPKTGQIGRGKADEIICWMMDTDYDGRSFYAHQIFFPGCESDTQIRDFKDGLGRNLDPDMWNTMLSCESQPFPKPKGKRIAVRIITATHTEMTTVVDTP